MELRAQARYARGREKKPKRESPFTLWSAAVFFRSLSDAARKVRAQPEGRPWARFSNGTRRAEKKNESKCLSVECGQHSRRVRRPCAFPFDSASRFFSLFLFRVRGSPGGDDRRENRGPRSDATRSRTGGARPAFSRCHATQAARPRRDAASPPVRPLSPCLPGNCAAQVAAPVDELSLSVVVRPTHASPPPLLRTFSALPTLFFQSPCAPAKLPVFRLYLSPNKSYLPAAAERRGLSVFRLFLSCF